MLTIPDVQVALGKLGYFAGPIDGDLHAEGFRDDLTRFQRDYPACGKQDGWYGPKTDAVLAPLIERLRQAVTPAPIESCRRWRLTRYFVGNARAHGAGNVPIWGPSSGAGGAEQLAQVSAAAFVEAALNGSTMLPDGRLVTVAGWVDVRMPGTTLFKPVIDIAKRQGWIPSRVGYAGIQLSNDQLQVTRVRTFAVQPVGPGGGPLEHGIECVPFRTVAADLGTLPGHDPSFRGKGGVAPVGTRAFVLELVGLRLPDGSIHDGWVTVNDTGGAIVGAHFDLYTGQKALDEDARVRGKIPELAHVWFQGIEERLPYYYGVGI